jgi:hypothetical protein
MQHPPAGYPPQPYPPGQFAPGQFAPQQFAPQQFAPQQFAPPRFVPPPRKKSYGGLIAAIVIGVLVLCGGGLSGAVWYWASYKPAQGRQAEAALVAKLGIPEGFAVDEPFKILFGNRGNVTYILHCEGTCVVDPVQKVVIWAGQAGVKDVTAANLQACWGSYGDSDKCRYEFERDGYSMSITTDRSFDPAKVQDQKAYVYHVNVGIDTS